MKLNSPTKTVFWISIAIAIVAIILLIVSIFVAAPVLSIIYFCMLLAAAACRIYITGFRKYSKKFR